SLGFCAVNILFRHFGFLYFLCCVCRSLSVEFQHRRQLAHLLVVHLADLLVCSHQPCVGFFLRVLPHGSELVNTIESAGYHDDPRCVSAQHCSHVHKGVPGGSSRNCGTGHISSPLYFRTCYLHGSSRFLTS